MKNRFNIDFFEFSFLVEACIPPRPIARMSFWFEVINHYYHVLTPDERLRLYGWINLNSQMKTDNEDCKLFNARYDPDNQYIIKCIYEGEESIKECFLWKNHYYVSRNTYIGDEFIIESKKMYINE